jgi:hypothetical protein
VRVDDDDKDIFNLCQQYVRTRLTLQRIRTVRFSDTADITNRDEATIILIKYIMVFTDYAAYRDMMERERLIMSSLEEVLEQTMDINHRETLRITMIDRYANHQKEVIALEKKLFEEYLLMKEETIAEANALLDTPDEYLTYEEAGAILEHVNPEVYNAPDEPVARTPASRKRPTVPETPKKNEPWGKRVRHNLEDKKPPARPAWGVAPSPITRKVTPKPGNHQFDYPEEKIDEIKKEP